jgi:hypothetical protein
MSSSLAQRDGATDGAEGEGVTEGAAGVSMGATFAINRGTYLFDMDTILSVVSLFKFITNSFVNFFYEEITPPSDCSIYNIKDRIHSSLPLNNNPTHFVALIKCQFAAHLDLSRNNDPQSGGIECRAAQCRDPPHNHRILRQCIFHIV